MERHGPADLLMVIPSWRRGRAPVAALAAAAALLARFGHANSLNRFPSRANDVRSECVSSLSGKSRLPCVPQSAGGAWRLWMKASGRLWMEALAEPSDCRWIPSRDAESLAKPGGTQARPIARGR